MIDARLGDSREVLRGLAAESIDACVTDPPYALASIVRRYSAGDAKTAASLKTDGRQGVSPYMRAASGFMGHAWDTGETAFDPAFWVEVLRVLKPGAHVVAFGGTKTYHRLACAIEDAGFEIRDMLAWLYGSGFPKSHNQGGEWQGWGTALKPALEPICFARKPLGEKTVAANLAAHGAGALNVDGCRVEAEGGSPSAQRRQSDSFGSPGKDRRREDSGRMGRRESQAAYQAPRSGEKIGRWPANVIHDGSAEVIDAFPETGPGAFPAARGAGGIGNDDHSGQIGLESSVTDVGSAARFFFSAKADAGDRHGSGHPTVKPVDLMRWLCTLVTAPGGVVLDPFAGTGTTGLAAEIAGFDSILIEREPTYFADIQRRIAWLRGEGRLTALEQARDLDPATAAGEDIEGGLFSVREP